MQRLGPKATGLFCVRYVDEVLVLAPTRSKLQRAVRVLNESFAALGLDKHSDKTFIGRAAGIRTGRPKRPSTNLCATRPWNWRVDALHPGTVATALSAPFAATGLEVHTPSG